MNNIILLAAAASGLVPGLGPLVRRPLSMSSWDDGPSEVGVEPVVFGDDDEDDEDTLLDELDVEDWAETRKPSLFDEVIKVYKEPSPGRLACLEEREQHKETYKRHDADCGSSEVQIALFTARIKHVTQHVVNNPKDHGSRRGLLALVSKRRRLLHYYFKKDPAAAEELADTLGIRFRFKSKLPTRAEKYRQFRKRKS